MRLFARCKTVMLIVVVIVMRVVRFAKTFFAMEYEEIHAERIEGGYKYAC